MKLGRVRVVQRLVSVLVPGQRSQHDKHLNLSSHPTDASDFEPSEFAVISASDESATQVLAAVDALPHHLKFKLELVLWLLSTRLGTLLLCGPACITGKFPFVQRFADLPPRRVERIVRGWLRHLLPQFRVLGRALKGIAMHVVVANASGVTSHPLNAAIGYEGRSSEAHRAKGPSAAVAAAEGSVQQCIVAGTAFQSGALSENVAAEPQALVELLERKGVTARLAQRGDLAASKNGAVEVVVETDAVIVGSGAGGGVVAGTLAQAGLGVVVLEKGPYVHPTNIAENDAVATRMAYESQQHLITHDTGIPVLAGSGVGGGTRVNWCASFRTPPHVREEWAAEHGLAFMREEGFTEALDVVCARLGVHSEPAVHRDASATGFVHGMQAIGEKTANIPQNCERPEACSTQCSLGCRPGGKQDAARTWLADAAATGRLALFVRCSADKVVTQNGPSGEEGRKHAATGVIATLSCARDPDDPDAAWRPPVRVLFKARAVVSSAGSLHTPALLLRSGIKARGNVGRHLRLHPATVSIGHFDSADGTDTADAGLEGPMMAVYNRGHAKWDALQPQQRYGPFLSVIGAVPAVCAAQLPFESGAQYENDLLGIGRMRGWVVYCRDDGRGGRVTLGSEGEPKLAYHATKGTQDGMLEGLVVQLRAMHAAGATRLLTMHGAYTAWNRPPAAAEADKGGDVATGGLVSVAKGDADGFEAWLRTVRKRGANPYRLTHMSAHQMGTARMGADRRRAVVDTRGESWGVRGLYVADASLFPTASGVNPMVTTEALAYVVAQNIAEDLQGSRPRVYSGAAAQTFEW